MIAVERLSCQTHLAHVVIVIIIVIGALGNLKYFLI